jgi:hypothetical protein
MDFTEFPNTSPSGKWVDSDNPFPQTLLNIGKKTSHLERRSEHASSEKLATVESRRFLETTPPPIAPINSEVRTVKFFDRPLAFSELLPTSSHKGSS